MLNRIFVMVMGVMVFAGVCLADDPTVTVTISSHATTGLSGYTTYVVNIDSDDNLDITSVGMTVETSGAMVMNQVNPATLSTVFDNYPVALWTAYGEDKDQDSMFLFNSNDMMVVNGSDDHDAEESSTVLQAYFTGTDFLTADVVQVVLPDSDWASFNGTVVVDDNGDAVEIEVSGVIGN